MNNFEENNVIVDEVEMENEISSKTEVLDQKVRDVITKEYEDLLGY